MKPTLTICFVRGRMGVGGGGSGDVDIIVGGGLLNDDA